MGSLSALLLGVVGVCGITAAVVICIAALYFGGKAETEANPEKGFKAKVSK